MVATPASGQAPAQSTDKPESPNDDNRGTEQKNSDAPISILTVKPLDVRADFAKDWMDRLNWVFTLTLVLITGFGVAYARKTLKAMEGQLAEIKAAGQQTVQLIMHAGTQAAAAKASADALVGIDRAWLVFMFEDTEDATTARFFIQNLGNTPAWITELSFFYRKNGRAITVTPTSTELNFAPRVVRWDAGTILPAKGLTKRQTVTLDDGHPLSESQQEAARQGSLFLILVARVKYEDIFGIARETCVCQNFAPGVGWLVHGPRELNRRT